MTQAQFAIIRSFAIELDRLAREYEGTDNSDEWVHHKQYPEFQSDHKSGVISIIETHSGKTTESY